jgi:hypothetical protein
MQTADCPALAASTGLPVFLSYHLFNSLHGFFAPFR